MDSVRLSVMCNGVAYLCGSAGSLILSCPRCGRDRFRDPLTYWHHPPEWERCFKDGTVLEPVRVDEVESRWLAIWSKDEGQDGTD